MKKAIPVYLTTKETNILDGIGLIGKGRSGKFSEWVRGQIQTNLSKEDIKDELERYKTQLKLVEIEKINLDEKWKLTNKKIIELEQIYKNQLLKKQKIKTLEISNNEFDFLENIKNELINNNYQFAVLKIRKEDYEQTFNKKITIMNFKKLLEIC